MSVDHIFAPPARGSVAMMSTTRSSSNSEISDGAAASARLGFPRSTINIELDNHFSSKVFTSSSPVSGSVTITTRRDVRFDHIQILLVGTCRTRVDGVNSLHAVTHTFLKMSMPISESAYPVPRVMEAGRSLNIPFNFVIPNYLTINACNHHVESDQLQDHHVLMPPSMGSWERDDMAPQMAEVEYSVKARVFRQPDLDGKTIKVMEASRQIRVLPASAEQPPLVLSKNDKLYNTSKTKTIRRNLLSGKLGKLTAEATQPDTAFVRPDGRGISSTTAQVQLKFEPSSADSAPPAVTAVAAKVVSHTYYSSVAIACFPNLGDWTRQLGVEKRGSYSTSVAIPPTSMDKRVRWHQSITASARRDSGYSSGTLSNSESDSENTTQRRESRGLAVGNRKMKTRTGSPLIHTTTLQLPIQLPAGKKTFIPTFHSCIASRVYTLQLSVTVSTGSNTSTISLSLPLQVAVEADPTLQAGHNERLPSFETAVEEAAADDFLRPRLMQVPENRFMQTSTLPAYGSSIRVN